MLASPLSKLQSTLVISDTPKTRSFARTIGTPTAFAAKSSAKKLLIKKTTTTPKQLAPQVDLFATANLFEVIQLAKHIDTSATKSKEKKKIALKKTTKSLASRKPGAMYKDKLHFWSSLSMLRWTFPIFGILFVLLHYC